MPEVQLDGIEARSKSPTRRSGMAVDNLQDAGGIQWLRRGPLRTSRDRTWTNATPRAGLVFQLLTRESLSAFPERVAARLPTGMCELNAHRCSLRMGKVDDLGELPHMLVCPNAEIVDAEFSLRGGPPRFR